MKIAKTSVNKPVTTLMIFLGIILLGFISLSKLPMELFPSITYPQITVVTSYQNAAPEEIENLITKVIEEATGTVNNVKRISSISKEGLSLVMVEFNWGTNMDFAALNVREKIDLIKEKLPRDAQEPIVMKYNPFDLPVLNLAVTGPLSQLELREMCRKYIKDSIEKVEGVASATISGGDEREILVEIDQARLRASQIPIVSVVDSLKAANLNYPAGTLKESFYEYLIRTMGEYQKVGEIQETPAALDVPEENAKTNQEKEKKERQGRRLVMLKDIAKVKDTIKEKTSISRYNGNPSISLVVRKQSGANSLNVVNGVNKEIKRLLEEKLPKDIKIEVTYDQSQFIKEAINSVRDAALQGAFLAFIVLFFFLLELKSSLIITLSIPISIMATFCLMYFGKIDLNIMSLGGLALGIGNLVDNSVVVIENIFRLRQLGTPLKEASIDGADEMVAPVMGSTLTTVAVFLPFAFVVGIAGQIFKQLSMTITFSLMTSIIVAISLVPMLISLGRQKVKTSTQKKFAFIKKIHALIDHGKKSDTMSGYEKLLRNLVEKKERLIMIVFFLFSVSLIVLIFGIEKQFMPKVDQRQFIIKVDLPPGSRIETTDASVKKIESLLLAMPDIKNVTINIGSSEEKVSAEETALQTLGSHQAQIMVNLKKKSKKEKITRSTEDIIKYLKQNLENKLQGAEIEYIAQETSFGSALEQGAPIAIEIKGSDLNLLTEIANHVFARVKKIDGTFGVKNNMPSPSPETKLHILKDRSSLYGLSVQDIAVTAQVALKGYVATKFKDKATQEDIDIRVRLRPSDRADLGNLRRLLIHSPLGTDIFLSEVAYLTKGTGPTEIKRVDQQRSIMITANAYNKSINKIIANVNGIVDFMRTKIPKDYSITLAGEQQKMQESFASLAFALILAFTLVYMIMAAEFESLWQPLLIMFTIPLSLIGVTFALLITRTPLSVVAYLGIIMLGGIAVNNGIVLIDFVNTLRAEGYTPYEAAIQASKTRLRPIMMTSLTTILGLLPLALGIGEGSELQAPLALTVMGGLLSATFLTLVFIPSLYLTVLGIFDKTAVISAPAPVPPPAPQPKIETPVPPQETKEEPETSQTGSLFDEVFEKPVAAEQTPPTYLEVSLPSTQEDTEKKEEPVVPPSPPPEELTTLEVSIPSVSQPEKENKPEEKKEKEEITLPEQKSPEEKKIEETPEITKQIPQTAPEPAELKTQELEPFIKPEQKTEEKTSAVEQNKQHDEETKPEITIEEIKKETPQIAEQENIPKIETGEEPLPEKPDIQQPEDTRKPEIPAQIPAEPKPEEQTKKEAPEQEEIKTGELNPRQIEILEKLKTLTKITRKEYAQMFTISVPTAARDLKELVDRKLLRSKGPLGPGRWYELNS